MLLLSSFYIGQRLRVLTSNVEKNCGEIYLCSDRVYVEVIIYFGIDSNLSLWFIVISNDCLASMHTITRYSKFKMVTSTNFVSATAGDL